MSAAITGLPAIDGERLWVSLVETSAFGATPAGGVCRLALSEEDRHVRDWLRAACLDAGCEVVVDRLGTIYATRPGRDPARPPIAFGSHLDTQPTGGRFDGILGVLAGLEVIRALNDAGIETDAPLCLVNWTNEEGARFAPGMMASGVYAGDFGENWILDRRDSQGISVGAALDAIGYRGEMQVGARRFAAFLELHIEQGPILEAEGAVIGVVEGAQGQAWYDGRVLGRASHAGTTPMALRRDALAGLSELVLCAERIALNHAPGVATLGVASLEGASRNVVPGEVSFTLEMRHPEAAALTAMQTAAAALAEEIAARRGLEIALDPIWRKEPVVFDPRLVETVEAAAADLGHVHRRMASGAGHDAVNLAAATPTAMIFIPCREGISHNEAEYASPAHCAAGAEVLLRAVLALAG